MLMDDDDMSLATIDADDEHSINGESQEFPEDLTSLLDSSTSVSEVYVHRHERYERPNVKCMLISII